jgi:hypothetical protein
MMIRGVLRYHVNVGVQQSCTRVLNLLLSSSSASNDDIDERITAAITRYHTSLLSACQTIMEWHDGSADIATQWRTLVTLVNTWHARVHGLPSPATSSSS